jgi:hypothetical protein
VEHDADIGKPANPAAPLQIAVPMKSVEHPKTQVKLRESIKPESGFPALGLNTGTRP